MRRKRALAALGAVCVGLALAIAGAQPATASRGGSHSTLRHEAAKADILIGSGAINPA